MVGMTYERAKYRQLPVLPEPCQQLMPKQYTRAFRYWGAKNMHLSWLLPMLPYKRSYVEPFGGSLSVLLNRERSKEEHANDLSGGITAFFKAVRDHKEELIESLRLTPRSKDEYDSCWPDDETASIVQRGRAFYVRVWQSRNGAYSKGTSWRAGTNPGSPTVPWLDDDYEARFEKIRNRLQEVHIHNRDAISLIKLRDAKDVTIYCDPPYAHDTRESVVDYDNEMNEQGT